MWSLRLQAVCSASLLPLLFLYMFFLPVMWIFVAQYHTGKHFSLSCPLSHLPTLSLSLSALQSHPHSETAAGENLDLDLYWPGLGLPGTSTTKGNSQRTVWCHPITHKLQAPKKAHSDYRNGDRQQPHLTLSFPSVRVSCASKCKEQNPKGSFWDA